MELEPRKVVAELDRFIVGQGAAKRALAIALRNRIRRCKLPLEQQAEISPKNIMLIGPTGVGKTELARRLAALVKAPFVKVEATKYTEVGYVGRDVESMIRDLVDNAVRTIRQEKTHEVTERAGARVEDRILAAMMPRRATVSSPFETLLGMRDSSDKPEDAEANSTQKAQREDLRRRLRAGELEDLLIEVEVSEQQTAMFDMFANTGMGDLANGMQEMLGNILPQKKKRRKVTVQQARNLFLQEEVDNLLDAEEIARLAIERTEQMGIVFIDEIDKVAGRSHQGPDVSREGVQRDILPIVEGSTVTTKYGPVRTEHVLFIAAGAFHVSKPSDLIPELQGRFPIRVELDSLTEADLERILVEPENALLSQYRHLIGTEGVDLEFTADAVSEIARIAHHVNSTAEDIGARRLHTVLEQVMDEIAFDPYAGGGDNISIDAEYVRVRLQGILQDEDLSRYIL